MFDDLHDPTPPTATADHLATVAERAERRRRRRTAGVMGATTVVLVAAGTVALTLREPGDAATTTVPAPVTTVPAPATTAVPSSTSAAPASTMASTSTTTSTTTSPSIVVDPRAAPPTELVELAATIAERARAVPSFGGRVEQHATQNGTVIDQPTRDVVLRADGSMWATDDRGGWTSFDATTGVSRLAFRIEPDEPLMYQEIVGWNENSVGENVILGAPPVLDPTTLHGELTITEASYPEIPDRPAWRIDQATTCCQMPGEPSWADTTTFWVDQATGIMLSYETSQVETADDGTQLGTSTRGSRFTTFTTDIEMPPEFPGAFPTDAAVDRSGDPAAFNGAMSDADLATAFGPGLLVPDVPGSTRQIEVMWAGHDAQGLPVRDDGMAQMVSFRVARGFDRTWVTVSRGLDGPPAGALPAGEVPGGVLAGLPIYPTGSQGFTVTPGDGRGDVRVEVRAATVEQAAELMAAMRPAGG